MRVLVVGSGAREHALVARLAAERDAADLVGAPGNPGIAAVARTAPVDVADPISILELADQEHVDFTVIGPELPLSLGVADRFSSDPLTANPRFASSSAMPLMPMPPTPMK